MRVLLCITCLLLISGCSTVSPNLQAYYETVAAHDIQQTQMAASTVQAIRATSPATGFSTPAEATMFAVVQAMLIERVKYVPIGIDAPLTGYDYLSRATGPILSAVNPWLLWWAADTDSGNSRSGNSAYNSGGGDILVNSANAGSQNSGSYVEANGITTNFKTENSCITGDCGEDGDINPLIPGEAGYECSEGEMVTPTCSCVSRQSGKC